MFINVKYFVFNFSFVNRCQIPVSLQAKPGLQGKQAMEEVAPTSGR